MERLAPNLRLRRLRATQQIRDLVAETQLNIHDLIMPLFIKYGTNRKDPISSMPGIYQLSLDKLPEEIEELRSLGIQAIILFGIPEYKDAMGSLSYAPNGIIQQAINIIKNIMPEMLVIADVCCCEYTDHGHCGVISETPYGMDVDNDQTLEVLAQQALSLAQAGADILAPSGMMDGQVGRLRYALDKQGFIHLPILSYSVKYASALYGPFREAAEGAPQFGNRKSYQMNPANSKEALREINEDLKEGVDMVMVKPAQYYLDVIFNIKQNLQIPLGAYQVSGEFAMIKAAAQQGWLDEKKMVLEALTGIKRAGADFIISYFTKEIANYL